MLSAVCLMMALSVPPTGPLFKEMGLTYTGQNGFEELVLALEQQSRPGVREDLSWLRWAQSGWTTDEPPRPAGRSSGMSNLEVRRAKAARWREAAPLLREAVRKGGKSPSEKLKLGADFYVFAPYRALSFVAAAQVHVSFAEGQGAQAIDTVALFVSCGRFLEQMSMVGAVVSFATNKVVLAELEPHLLALDLPTARRLAELARAQIEAEPWALACLRGELSFALQAIGELPKPETREEWLDLEGTLTQAEADSLAKMGPAAMAKVIEDTRAELRRRFEQVFLVAEQPESAWGRPLPEVPANTLAGKLAESAMSVTNYTWRLNAESRAQWRVLRLFGLAAAHRWETGKRPTMLSDFAPPELRIDPLNGREFEFFSSEDRFMIRSAGSAHTGPITASGRARGTERATDKP